jgi:SAM-dependent MidA family methyltransferase
MQQALYGPGGFYLRSGAGPAGHFRTSVHASDAFAAAIGRLLARVDEALQHPSQLRVVDVGAGRGELLTALAASLPPELAARVRLTGVELVDRPAGLPNHIEWVREPPPGTVGLLVAVEWLDNVPVDVVAGDPPRYVHVDGALGSRPSVRDARWLREWWPLDDLPEARAEIGATRDAAWAGAVSTVERGLALAVDYGHLRAGRPVTGTLTGFRAGREVEPRPDGSCDLTAHVAFDSVAAAGAAVAGRPPVLRTQRDCLRALGVTARRPPLSHAYTDPLGYVRTLATASSAAELIDSAGLGGHWWLLQPVGLPDRADGLWVTPPVVSAA